MARDLAAFEKFHAENPDEEWRPVVGYEGRYEVSNLGRVRSLWLRAHHVNRPRVAPIVLRPAVKRHGYLMVHLARASDRRSERVHCLVLAAFVGPRPAGADAAHFDGNPANNTLSNLRWATKQENEADKIRHGTRGGNPERAKRICELRERGLTLQSIADQYGVTLGAIFAVVKRCRPDLVKRQTAPTVVDPVPVGQGGPSDHRTYRDGDTTPRRDLLLPAVVDAPPSLPGVSASAPTPPSPEFRMGTVGSPLSIWREE